jgi:DNA-binding transcriptional regulator YhcF (GntR family)
MQRAFTVLEAERLFVTRGTVGRFITTDTEVLDRAREILRRETVARLVEEAQEVGLSPEELIAGIRIYVEGLTAPPADTPSGKE